MPKSTLGERIASLRGSMSQLEFAGMFDVSRNTLSRYENNSRTPDAEFLQKLVAEFKLDANWLLLGVGEPPTLELSSREAALIANYRASPEEGRRSLETTSALLAKSQSQKVKKAG